MSFTTTDGSRAQDGTDAAVAFPHPMVDAALHYGERWSIFPCHWPLFKAGKVMCSCGKPPGKGKGLCSSPGKHPRTAHGFYDATRDPDAIRALWRRMPLANIGLRTGTDNDLLVLDVDPPHGGDKSLAAMVAKHGPLPPTLIANTGSGGRHFLFRHVDGLSNSCRSHRRRPRYQDRGRLHRRSRPACTTPVGATSGPTTCSRRKRPAG